MMGIIAALIINIVWLGKVVFEICVRRVHIGVARDPLGFFFPPGDYSLVSNPSVYYPVIYCHVVVLPILCFLLFMAFREKK